MMGFHKPTGAWAYQKSDLTTDQMKLQLNCIIFAMFHCKPITIRCHIFSISYQLSSVAFFLLKIGFVDLFAHALPKRMASFIHSMSFYSFQVIHSLHMLTSSTSAFRIIPQWSNAFVHVSILITYTP